ncbi:lipase member J [Halyomorpha halys]|uniref:lipase member J n=1 Tax=Halyomorpha halys TaxID=286706 RepID=UPI0006D5208F|nr:lipase member J-like [Halyomorpha halys]
MACCKDAGCDNYCVDTIRGMVDDPTATMKPITFVALLLPLLLLAVGVPAQEEEEEEEEEEDEEEDTEPPPPQGPPLQPLCDLATLYGYKCEEHHVVTKDGYKLDLYRLLPAKEPSGATVFISHGLLLSAEIYAIFNNSIGYQLVDEGHDVWLSGIRGTVHGRNHTTLNPDTDEKFWDFTWQEAGLYDLPTQIDYVIEKTKAKQIHYIGHSIGTTTFFLMASKVPETASKIKNAILLAPVFFFTKYQFMLKEGSSMYTMAVDTMKGFEEKKKWEAYPRSDVPKTEHQIVCEDLPSMAITYCNMGMDMSRQRVGDFMPAGTSKKNLEHLQQCIMKGKATFFDYGEEKNNVVYGQAAAPEIDLKAFKNKLNVFYCESDHLASTQDVQVLLNEITVDTKHYIEDENFNHLDFIFPTSQENEKNYKTVVQKMKEILSK